MLEIENVIFTGFPAYVLIQIALAIGSALFIIYIFMKFMLNDVLRKLNEFFEEPIKYS